MKRMLVIAVVVGVLFGVVGNINADPVSVPQMINYQGRFTDTAGDPVTGTHSIALSIYDVATDGTALWTETHPSVSVDNGIFHVIMGSVTPIDLSFGEDYWLGVSIDATDELAPRRRLVSVAYAFRAQTANALSSGVNLEVDGDTTIDGSLTVNNLIYPTTDGTDGQVLKTDGAGALNWITVGGGTGDVGGPGSSTDHAVVRFDGMDGKTIQNSSVTIDDSGNTDIGGTLTATGTTALNGGLTMDTDKFTVADTSGNTTIGGTLGVTGATTLSSTLDVTGATGIDGNFDINTNKFTVVAASGNTSVAGTLGVTGALTASGLAYPTSDGTDGQFLKTDGSGTLSWAAAGGGAAINDLSDAMTDGSNLFLGSDSGASNDGANNSITAVGFNALTANTTGINNTAVGYRSLYSNTTGHRNTAHGYQALYSNTSGGNNTAIGEQALEANTTGNSNTASGYFALTANTIGEENTATGLCSLESNTEGSYNTAVGGNSLKSNTTGNYNMAYGSSSLYSNTIGSGNIALGYQAGRYHQDGFNALTTPENSIYIGYRAKGLNNDDDNSIVIGSEAVGIGANSVVLGNDNILTTALKGNVGVGTTAPTRALDVDGAMHLSTQSAPGTPAAGDIYSDGTDLFFYNGSGWDDLTVMTIDDLSDATTDGAGSVFLGLESGTNDDGGNSNTAVGTYSLNAVTSGMKNTAVGSQALNKNTTASYNTAIGFLALNTQVAEGDSNTAIGYEALRYNTEGDSNAVLGCQALRANTTGGQNTATGVNALRNNTEGSNNTACGISALVANTSGDTNTALGGSSLYSNTNGSKNVAVGYMAARYTNTGGNLQTPENSVYIGYDARGLGDDDSNSIVIGYQARGLGVNTVVLGNDSITTTALKGNVGIETTDPGSELDVKGTIRLSGSSSGYVGLAPATAAGDTVYTLPAADGSDGHVLTTDGSGTLSWAAAGGGSSPWTESSGDIYRSSGKVGIGTVSPTRILEVEETMGVTQYDRIELGLSGADYKAQLRFQTGSPFEIIANETDLDIDFVTRSSTEGFGSRLRIKSDGKVGIGTTTPASMLELVKADDGNLDKSLILRNTGTSVGTGAYIQFQRGTGTALANIVGLEGTSGQGHLAFYTGASGTLYERIRIDPSGRLGIGTTDPQQYLHLYNSGPAIRIEDTNGDRWDIENVNGEFWIQNDTDVRKELVIKGDGSVLFNGGGNVAIGTTSPNEQLTVEGSLSLDEITAPSETSGYGKLYVKASDSKLYYLDDGGTHHDLTGGGGGGHALDADDGDPTDRVYVRSNGMVGIGTTSPTMTLEINDVNPYLRLTVPGTINAWDIGTHTDYFKICKIGQATAIAITDSGNVGIGTTSPSYKLDVNGQPGCNGWSSFTNYSDERLKENVEPVGDVLEGILGIKPCVFNYNERTGYDEESRCTRFAGFVAQELQEIFPEMVGTTIIDEQEYLDSNLSRLPVYLVKALQEQQEIIKSIQEENRSIRKEKDEQQRIIEELRVRLDALEQR